MEREMSPGKTIIVFPGDIYPNYWGTNINTPQAFVSDGLLY